jgi:RimJ/RimL family protein N-acetyltransferase
MNDTLFLGDLVRLTAEDPQVLAEALSRWSRDTQYWRLLASDPSRAFSVKSTKEWLEKELNKDSLDLLLYSIHTLNDDRLIGEIDLDGIQWNHGDAFVGIGLGERDYWGKGFGTDALRVLERYAFTELNLHRLSLTVFDYNPRAIRSYEKAGFIHEGRVRGFLNRDGQRWDMLLMGILKEEWREKQH